MTSYYYGGGQLRGLTLISAPAEEPLTLAAAKRHCHIDDDLTDDDEDISGWITEAREKVEEMTGLALVDQTWEIAYPGGYAGDGYAPYGIPLPKPPLIGVLSYIYTDTDGVVQTLAADQYTVDTSVARRPLLVPAYGVTWPAVRSVPAALKIQYRSGFAHGSPRDMSLVPRRLVNAMKVYISYRNENREVADMPPGFENLLRALRVEGLA